MNRETRNRILRLLPTALIALLLLLSATYAQWFENGTPVCVTPGDQTAPETASDSRGETVIAWRGGGVVVQRINAFGDLLWDPDGVVLCHGNTRDHRLVVDPTGSAMVTWSYRRGQDFEIYLQRLTRYGTTLYDNNGIDICSADGDEERPAIATVASGEYVVAWQDGRGADRDIYAQRVSSSGALLWDGAGMPVCTEPGEQRDPLVTGDGSGGVIVAWLDSRGADPDIYAQRLGADGAAIWAPGGIPLCAAAGEQSALRIIPDGLGGIIAVWQDGRSPDLDIFAQRVGADGELLWDDDGMPVCFLAADQSLPDAVSDGSGGAIIAWSDMRNGEADIMAQRINDSGFVLWQGGGITLCSAAGTQTLPRVTSDGTGGAIVAWQDARGDAPDIRAQRITKGGVISWEHDGIVVCDAPGDQRAPRIATDGAGGAFVPWEDSRSGEIDIYAHRVTSLGLPAEPPVSDYEAFVCRDGIAVKWTVSSDAALLRYSIWRAVGVSEVYSRIMPMIEEKGNSFGFIDVSCEPGVTYTYRVEYRSGNKSYTLFTTRAVQVPAERQPRVQNHPNPFNPSTTISYMLPERGRVRIEIYDAAGRRIARLVDAVQEDGIHRVTWDGRDANGSEVASGVYFSRLETESETVTKKMVLVR